jgi:hypothetical protein
MPVALGTVVSALEDIEYILAFVCWVRPTKSPFAQFSNSRLCNVGGNDPFFRPGSPYITTAIIFCWSELSSFGATACITAAPCE